jgi:hypothetical protein
MMGYFAFQNIIEITSSGHSLLNERWEYKIVGVGHSDSQKLEWRLTYFGSDGWEVCGSWIRGESFVILKRRLPSITGNDTENPAEAFMAYTKNVTMILKNSHKDCERTISELSEYVVHNKNRIEKLNTGMEEFKKTMTNEERGYYEETHILLVDDLVHAMLEFRKNCPEQIKKSEEISVFPKKE